ncbi:MAG: chemotaxis protein CheX [Lachnospira sp.]|nr:chemotaxis protein CheX [Lachnospira sp.]
MKGKMFNSYIAQNRAGTTFNDHELKAIQSGDVDSLVREFCDMKSERYVLQLQCLLKSIGAYMGDVVELNNISLHNEYKGTFLGCQVMDGDTDVFLGIAGDDDALLKVASKFAMEDLQQFNMDAYDALCEMINVINGAYATQLSEADVEVDLHPPVFYTNTLIEAEKGFYVVTFTIDGKEFQMLMVADNKVRLIA